MKITIHNLRDVLQLRRVPGIVKAYIDDGYADGSRPHQRDCVLYSNTASGEVLAIWGGPEHIRLSVANPDNDQGDTGDRSV